MHMKSTHIASTALFMLAGAASVSLSACSKERRETRKVETPIVRDVPQILQGTIGAETSFRGIDPVLVSGFGLVVGLPGTGGGEIDVSVAATMEREIARNGVGKGASSGNLQGIEGVSPAQLLRDPNTAVVIVEAAVPPGAPEGVPFDVSVRTLPGSGVTSLEGGTLWSTDLRVGPATTFGGYKTRKLAEAYGPVFINPFAEPGSTGINGSGRGGTVGRVLGGGVVTEPLKIALVLDDPSHARARSMVAAINGRFPQSPMDRDPIAQGRDAGSIALSVPWDYRERSAEFIELIRHLRVDPSYPEEWARAYTAALKEQPYMATDISWCLQAIGKGALPFVSSMYDYPELTPRMSALEVGARLGDHRVTPHLVEIAKTAPPAMRAAAIELLGDMPPDPAIGFALRELVDYPDLNVRVAAYEALSKRGFLVDRINVEDKFTLELVPSDEPLIYVTQQGLPRIAIFGGGTAAPGEVPLRRPMLMRTWSDRLMMDSESASAPVRLFYRDYRTQKAQTFGAVPAELAGLVEFLAHAPTPEHPEPGLGMAYSEVVGALYELSRQNAVPAAFATEQDRLRAAVFEASQTTDIKDHPETSERPDESGGGNPIIFKPQSPTKLESVEPTKPEHETWVVPLTKPSKEEKK